MRHPTSRIKSRNRLYMTEKEWKNGSSISKDRHQTYRTKQHLVGEVFTPTTRINEDCNAIGCGNHGRITRIVRLKDATKYFFEKVER